MEELKINIIKLMNESELPLEALVFVTKDVYRDVNEAFQQKKLEEQLKKQKEQKEDEINE